MARSSETAGRGHTRRWQARSQSFIPRSSTSARRSWRTTGSGRAKQSVRPSGTAGRRCGPDSRTSPEATHHWQKVRALVAELPESAETVPFALQASRELLNAAWRTGVPDAEADALFADARALAERTVNCAPLPSSRASTARSR